MPASAIIAGGSAGLASMNTAGVSSSGFSSSSFASRSFGIGGFGAGIGSIAPAAGISGIGPGSGFDAWGWGYGGPAGLIPGSSGCTRHGHGALWNYWSPSPGHLWP